MAVVVKIKADSVLQAALHLPRPQPGTENGCKDGFPRYPAAVCLTSFSPASPSPVSCANFN